MNPIALLAGLVGCIAGYLGVVAILSLPASSTTLTVLLLALMLLVALGLGIYGRRRPLPSLTTAAAGLAVGAVATWIFTTWALAGIDGI